MMMLGAGLALLSAVLLSAHAQSSTTTQYYPYFESLAVCAPVNVLINQSADSRYSITLEADPAVRQALVFDYDGGKGLGIESVGSFKSSSPIKITISLPPGVLQYVELDYTNSDLTIDVPFSLSKGEIANNGNGRVIVTRGLDGGLAKISSVGSGDVLMRGKATYSEVFSAGSGNRYVSGFQGQLNIKHDGNGTFTVDPMTDSLNIAGVNTGSGPIQYTRGNCTVRKDPDHGPLAVGDACQKVASVSVPRQTMLWTCGIAVQGDYNCGGGGLNPPATVSSIPCSTDTQELVLLSVGNTSR